MLHPQLDIQYHAMSRPSTKCIKPSHHLTTQPRRQINPQKLPRTLLQMYFGSLRPLLLRPLLLRGRLSPKAKELPEGGVQAENEENETLRQRDEGEAEEDTC